MHGIAEGILEEEISENEYRDLVSIIKLSSNYERIGDYRRSVLNPLRAKSARSSEEILLGTTFGCRMMPLSDELLFVEAIEYNLASGYTIMLHDRKPHTWRERSILRHRADISFSAFA